MKIIPQQIAVSGLEPQNNKLNIMTGSAEKVANSFQGFLNEAINNVQDLKTQSNELTNRLATGEIDDIHQVMIAAEKASLSLQFVVQVRNKVVDAYQEVMRMQI